MTQGLTKVAVLGGSSPFAAELIRALEEGSVCGRELVIYGRSAEGIEAISGLGERRLGPLGWKVRGADRLSDALRDADCVLHQIRYGGMEGRESDEQLAGTFAVPADETLGPAGLQSGLRALSGLDRLATEIQRLCPHAWLVNLTNPLSLSTWHLLERGVARCVGLCELPWTTLGLACRLLDIPAAEVEWGYLGMNHRGFIHQIRHGGSDCIPLLAERLGSDTIDGVTAAEIRQLHAAPLKYHRLFRDRAVGDRGRAGFLMGLRRQILDELRARPGEYPPSLRKRNMPWYKVSVAPVLQALGGGEPFAQTCNTRWDGGLVWEVQAAVDATGVRVDSAFPANEAVTAWLRRFSDHERATADACLEPSLGAVERALSRDPTLQGEPPEKIAAAVWRGYSSSGPVELK